MTTPDATTSNPQTRAPESNPRGWLRRPLLWLSALLVVQLVVIAIVYWPAAPTSGQRAPLFANLDPTQVESIEIEDATGQSIVLERSNERWVVADTDGFPADAAKADDLLSGLAATTTSRLVTQTPGSHARLQVDADDFNRRLTLTYSDETTQEIYLGVTAGPNATHIRAGASDVVYLTGEVTAGEVEPFLSGWINTRYVSVAAADVNNLRLENAAGTIDLARMEDNQWTSPQLAQGETLDTNAVNSLLNQVTFLSMQDVLGQSLPDGASMDSADLVRVTMEITATPDTDSESDSANEDAANEDEAATSLTLEIGPLNDSSHFAKSSDSEYYVTVAAQTALTLQQFTLADLIAEQETAGSEITEPEISGPIPAPAAAPTGITPESPAGEANPAESEAPADSPDN